MILPSSEATPTPASGTRTIAMRTSGRKLGPIKRLISPNQLGEITKPFVFLDDADIPPGPGTRMNWHPHSGVGALTIITSGQNHYRETTGQEGSVSADGIEWMSSGKGVWHAASAVGETNLVGYQVWMLLPPEEALAPPYSRHFKAGELPVHDGVRVILGSWQKRKGPVPYDNAATLLDVRRKADEDFAFTIEAGHQLGWVAVQSGNLSDGSNSIAAGELVIFEDGDETIVLTATSDARFLAGSANRTEGPLHVGQSSVHCTAEALLAGEAEIQRLKAALG